MSSWVATHPPSASGSLTIWIERPSGVSMIMACLPSADVAQHAAQQFVDVAGEGSGGLAMRDDVAESAARLHDLRRQAVHLDIALVADDEPLRRIEQQQALRHVVDGGVEALLFQPQPLLRQRCCCDSLRTTRNSMTAITSIARAGRDDQEPDLLAPVGQRGRRRSCVAIIDDRKIGQRARRRQPVLAIDRTGQTHGAVVGLRQDILEERTVARNSARSSHRHADSAPAAFRRDGTSKSPRHRRAPGWRRISRNWPARCPCR